MSKADELLALVNKELGGKALFKGNDPRLVVEYIPTGMLPIDIAMGGGIPRGRFVEVYGPFSTLKSYIALNAMAMTQRMGGVAALADTEHAYDPEWAEQCGVDTSQLILVEGETGEEKLDSAEALIRAGVDLLVVDSIAAILPKAEHEKRLHKDTVQPARGAALMSLASRKLTAANTGRTAVFWINQIREMVGVTFGSPEKTAYGRAMGYYASVRLKISGAGKITEATKVFNGKEWTDGKLLIAQTYKAVVEKSKLNAPFSEVLFDWSLRGGQLDIVKFIFTQCVQHDYVTKAGNTWSYGSAKVVGRENFMDRMREDPVFLEELTSVVMTHHNLPTISVSKPKTVAVPSSPGKSAPRSRKVAVPKASVSSGAAPAPTPTPALAGSSGTGRVRKRSTS